MDRLLSFWLLQRLTLVCCLMLALAAFASSPAADLSRQIWRVQDGLPEDIVQAAAQDAEGFLWLGTTGGLARFDGSDFSILDAASSPRLPVNSVFCLLAAGDKSLWLGLEGGGLFRLQHGALTRYGVREGLSDPFVRALLQDRDGAVWVGTDNGLFLLRPGSRALVRLDTGAVAPMAVHAIAEDARGSVWVGGSRFLRFRRAAPTLPEEYPLPGLYSRNRVKSILPAADGTLWVGTVGGLLHSSSAGAPGFRKVSPVIGTVRALHQTRDGAIWIGTIGHGMWLYRAAEGFERIDAGDLLPSKSILSIMEDRSGEVWVGTQGGLVRLSHTPVHLLSLSQASDPDFATISSDRGNTVWAVASSVFTIRGREIRPEHFPAIGDPPVRNVMRAADGSLWVGTDGDGAFQIRNGVARHYKAPGELTNNFIRAFLQTHNGDVWIAADEGLTRIGADRASRVEHYGMPDGLAYFSTRCLLEDARGDVWVGTEQGLSHWHAGRFVSDGITRALSQEKVWSLAEDKAGFLWIGTRDHGLFRARGAAVVPFARAQGLPTDSIYGILSAHGRLWFSGPNTLFSASMSELDSSSGSPERPVHVAVYALPFRAGDAQFYGGRQPSACRDSTGRLWFPSSRGPIYLQPSEIAPRSPVPIFLRDVAVDGQMLPADSGRSLQIPANSRRVIFNYAPLELGPQNSILFRYKLEGFDRTWTYAGSIRSASYTNLPAGHFRFRVESLDGAAAAACSLIRQPFFWQTWWFATGVLLLVVAIGWSSYQVHLARIRERFRATLVERGRLAREMHDTVIQGCTSISALLEAISLRGNTRAPETELLNYARIQIRTTINEARDSVWNLRHSLEPERPLPDILDSISANARREFQLAVTCQCEGNPVRLGGTAAHEVAMVVREAVHNAAIHGRPSSIHILAGSDAHNVRLRIADNGCGFVPREGEVHFGLTGMRERAVRLGGILEVRSAPGEGTVVEARFPLSSLRRPEEKAWQ